jgi:NADPH:quinone reductase-like Zn-dependent oxidoreductase
MQGTGIMVTSWPIVLGCDASGSVVEVGEGVTKFATGDGVFGCTRLGVPGYSTFQEYVSHSMSRYVAKVTGEVLDG